MKKNKKQRFISDKISELRAEGKNQQQSIAIALSMAENILQDGGTQPYTGKGYGKNMQEASKTIENNSWYFTDEDKKNKFLNATSTKGGNQEIVNFQNAYNTEIQNRLNNSGLPQQEREKLYNETAFTGKGVQGLDGKFGEFTSSRTMPTFTKKEIVESPQLKTTGDLISQKPKMYKVNMVAEDMSDGTRDFQKGSLQAYIQDRTEKQGGLTEEDLQYIQRGIELSNSEIEGKYNNEESKNNPKAQERYKKLKQSLQIEELKDGGKMELPKYQGNSGSNTFYQNPIIGGKSWNPNMIPSTSYNPGSFNFTNSVVPQQNRQASIGQLDLNNTLFTEPATQTPNATVATTTTAKPAITPQLKPEVTSALKGTAPEATDYISQIQKANETVRQDSQLSDENTTPQLQRQTPPIQFGQPYGGVDLNAASALFGQSIQQGDTAMGIASGAKLGLGLARNFMSGYAAGKDRNRVLNDYSSNMRNAMKGAETPVQFQEGGTANEQDQLLQQIAMMLQQGASPEQVTQELVSMGMPQEQASQMIQMVMQQSQAPQQEQVPQEQQMMQEGGVATQPEVPVEMANAEIEDGEYVQDGEGVKYAEGAKHSEGGIPTQLENGARVLSDYKKVGKDLSKQFSEQLGFEVKASDTFATVLDKFNRKEGFDKKVKHLDEYSDKLEKQEKTVKHDATLALNKQILMEEAQEDTQKLQELVQQQEGLFNMLFEAQEASKGIETEGNFMQQGGTVNDLMAKYNISAEEAMKLVPSFQGVEGSSTYTEDKIDKFGNRTNFQNITDAATVGQMYGEAPKYTPEEKEIIKKSYSKIVKDKKSLEELYRAIDSDSLVYNPGMLKALKEGKKMPLELQHKDEQGTYGQQDEDKLNGYLYREALGEDFQPGNPEYTKKLYEVVTEDLKEKGINWQGSPFRNQITEGVGNVNQQQPGFKVSIQAEREGNIDLDKFRKSTTEQKQALSRSFGVPVEELEKQALNTTNKFLTLTPKSPLQQPAPTTPVAETPMEIPTTPVVDVAQDKERNRLNFLNLPDQTPMLPWAMQAPAMLRQTIYAPRWNEISPEQQLTDIQRGRVATAEQMSFLPDSQQASSLFALDANAMAAQNKVRSETERYNQMARERTEAAEADQKTRQSAADVVAAQTYQQQLGNELESNEADWRGFYNRLQSNQMNNYLTTNEYNRSNAFNPDINFNGQGYEVMNTPTYSVDSSKIPMTQEPTKKKKSAKRFGK
jgi:hypothetical protein